MFRPSALAVVAASLALALASGEPHAQAAKKAPFAAEGDQRSSGQSSQNAQKRGWQAAPLTCNAQPKCTSSPSAHCVAVQHNFKDGTDRGRALEETIRRCERANKADTACGCITQCRQVARCS